MYKIKKNNKNILLIILIIFFSVKIDFFRNFYNIFSKNYDERMGSVYDFCSEEGIGYLRYLKKKFNINDNPEIINYIHVPNNDWAIINTKNINKKSDNIIFLNYPGIEKEIKLHKIKKNLYEFKYVEFYKDKYSKIKKIEINSNNIPKKDFIIEIFTLDKSLNKKIIKTTNFSKIKNSKINLSFKKIDLADKKLFFKLIDANSAFEINLFLLNKYYINDYKIIDNFENCYYVK